MRKPTICLVFLMLWQWLLQRRRLLVLRPAWLLLLLPCLLLLHPGLSTRRLACLVCGMPGLRKLLLVLCAIVRHRPRLLLGAAGKLNKERLLACGSSSMCHGGMIPLETGLTICVPVLLVCSMAAYTQPLHSPEHTLLLLLLVRWVRNSSCSSRRRSRSCTITGASSRRQVWHLPVRRVQDLHEGGSGWGLGMAGCLVWGSAPTAAAVCPCLRWHLLRPGLWELLLDSLALRGQHLQGR